MKAVLLVVAGAIVLARARPEIVTISGDMGDVTVPAWLGYAAGLAMMVFGLRWSLGSVRPHRAH